MSGPSRSLLYTIISCNVMRYSVWLFSITVSVLLLFAFLLFLEIYTLDVSV
jgi:hypothetical protein